MPTLPTNPHYVGDSGHVNDHNTIVSALSSGIYRTSTDLVDQAGTTVVALGAWSTWTPTLAQGTSTNISKTVQWAKYIRLGRTVFFLVRVDPTGAGQAGLPITLTLPVTASLSSGAIGSGFYYDASTSSWAGTVQLTGTTTIALYGDSIAPIGQLGNFATATNDFFTACGTYEASS